MIPPWTFCDVFGEAIDVFGEAITHLFFYFKSFRGVIGRALASHAIDPGSNPGHAMYIFFQVC